MSKINDGGPAFARPGAEHSQGGNWEQDGMSYRQWLVGMALAGSAAKVAVSDGVHLAPLDHIPARLARAAVKVADAAIAGLEREE